MAFGRALERIVDSLEDRVAAHEIALRGLKGFYEGSESIDRNEFHAYVASLRLERALPGLQGVAYCLRVNAADLESHETRMRAAGFPNYKVHSASAREEYRPLALIEPQSEDNLRVIGVDIAAIPEILDAQNLARDTGLAAITRSLLLRQDVGVRTDRSVVMYVPMYADGQRLGTVEERRASLTGWVSGPFRIKDFVEGIGRLVDDEVAIAIFDGPLDQATSLLYQAPGFVTNALPQSQSVHSVEVAGRTWTVAAQPLPVFAKRFDAGERNLIALLATALSLTVGWFTWFLSTRRDHAVDLAERMTQELRQTRDDLQATLDATPDWMFELDAQGRVLHCHNATGSSLHVQAAQLIGRILPDAASSKTAFGCRAALDAAASRGHSSGHEFELVVDGEIRWFELSVARKQGMESAAGTRFIALLRDVSERKQAAERTHRLAYFDLLTGLPNRRMLLDRLAQALGAASHAGRMGALMFLDLDNFKHINDAHGHSAGDALLVQVAERLTQALSTTDTVAHIGGDEFVVLVIDLSDQLDEASLLALRIAEALRQALDAPFSIGGQGFASSVSIGLTIFPKQNDAVEDLLREADTAMYRAKDLGRNRICFFESAMQADVQRRLSLEQDLKVAFASGQLSAFVQPQVEPAGAVVGAELLMRWQHPQCGAISPVEFIPVAEASDLIVHMGNWMVEQACSALAQLEAAGALVPLSVNVSQRQFRHEGFVAQVHSMLARTGARADHLVLEVTESLLAEQMEQTIARMAELVAIGVRFSIDDFGTGYSSLAYLKRMPLYELKIDRSFVQDTPTDPSDTAIVKTILAMARSLGLRVVAEGVETQAQADFLAANHCDVFQGYLFWRPEPLAGWVAQRVAQAG
ncbi:MAG: bifunctional diguanylate cyclase/phosphodiesterase [Giesbergeria sp.]